MAVSAQMVMQLRERTGAGMMECKKFLLVTNGDIEEAIIEMRKAGQAKADQKAARIAAEGVIAIATSDDGLEAVMLELNSETDFVARDTQFMQFAKAVAETALADTTSDLEQLKAVHLKGETLSIEEARQQLVVKIGENIQLRRITRLRSPVALGAYLHGMKIGVLVALNTGSVQVAKDLAMHVAASRPIVVSPDQVPADLIAREREIYVAQAQESGKPPTIIEKMVEGRVQKYLSDVSLLQQSFVKNPDLTVDQWLKQQSATVASFVRFEVGEGLEKKQDDFVAEVMAQVRDES